MGKADARNGLLYVIAKELGLIRRALQYRLEGEVSEEAREEIRTHELQVQKDIDAELESWQEV